MKKYLFFSFLFFLGCAHESKNDPSLRTPAQNASSVQRHYENSISCQMNAGLAPEANLTTTRQSALSGLFIGPRAIHLDGRESIALLRPFTSDGCSVSPDGIPMTKNSEIWVDCCVQHDTAYWIGGRRQQKEIADNTLEKCISQKGYREIGKVYKAFVKHFGGPQSTQTFRWGYGWNQKRSYSEVKRAEEDQINTMHGIHLDQVGSLADAATTLQRVCDTYDPAFFGLSDDEKKMYALLNSRLKNDDVIEWAYWDYFNRDKRQLQIKIKSCSDVLTATFEKSSGSFSLSPGCVE